MKRFVFALVIFLALISSSANAWENAYYKFANSILPIASKIASHQKFILQDSSQNDQEMQDFGYPPVSYGRLWQDNKNCVAYSYESAWKGATLCYFETSDQSLNFAGGLKIGSSLKQVEKFFSTKSQNKKIFNLQLDGTDLIFKFNNGVITKICFTSFEAGSGVPNKIFNTVKSRVDSILN